MIIYGPLGDLALGELPLDPTGRSTGRTDLPPYGPKRPINLNAWTWSYNLNLIGKDVLPAGDRVTDLAPGQVTPRPLTLRTWTWSYNLNLIGKDRLPAGEQTTALSPKQVPFRIEQTWFWKYNPNLIGKDRLPAGEQRTELPAQLLEGPLKYRSWTASFNLNLIGKDRLPIGESLTVRPPIPEYPIQLRTWVESQQLSGPVVAPFVQEDWPLPQRAAQPDRGFTDSYNLNLIGQDQLPTGQETNIVPKAPEYHAQLRTWTWSYNLNLIGQDRLPVGERTNEVPRAYEYSVQLRSLTGSYNRNLIGQDQLPPGKALFDRTAIQQPSVQTWISAAIKAAAAPAPFVQTDWPVPQGQTQFNRGYVAGYNLNLIGKDQLPFRQQDWPLAPDLFKANGRRGIDTWGKGININLFPPPPPVVLPFNQFSWPLPGRYPILAQKASFWPNGGNFAPPFIPPVPPPTPPTPSTTQGAPGLEWQPYDRIREPGPIGWR